MRLTQNFTDDEFKCPCCGRVDMDADFMALLQVARNIAGVPFHVTSGYRCSRYNRKVGGTRHSSHMIGLAADIRTMSSRERFAVMSGLIKAGFERVGEGDGYIHVDADPGKSQRVMWGYR